MAKLNESAAIELPLNDERLLEKKKINRHVAMALNHLNKRRDALLAQREKLNKEIAEVDAGILALDPA